MLLLENKRELSISFFFYLMDTFPLLETVRLQRYVMDF